MRKSSHDCLQVLKQLLLGVGLVSLCVIAAKAAAVGTAVGPEARIIGGTTTTISKIPYIVSLRYNREAMCGGTLVAPSYVVTAAHCIKGLRANQLQIVGGATKLSESGVRRGVSKIYSPTSYRESTLHYDVAVLKLSSPLSGNNIATIPLCNSSFKAGDTIQVSGWGMVRERAMSEVLRTVQLPLMSKSKCQRMYRGRAQVTDTMICASTEGSKDSCSGDSGGPAVFNGQLCGIVSWGIGCARSNSPGVYTNVKTVRTFINKAMQM